MTLIIAGLVDYSHFTFIILTFPYLLRAGNTLGFVASKQCAKIYWSNIYLRYWGKNIQILVSKIFIHRKFRWNWQISFSDLFYKNWYGYSTPLSNGTVVNFISLKSYENLYFLRFKNYRTRKKIRGNMLI